MDWGVSAVKKTQKKAFEYMTKSAENNFPLAQHALGFMYLEGECIEENIEKKYRMVYQSCGTRLNGISYHTCYDL